MLNRKLSFGGVAFLRDLFSSVSTRVNGYEHQLARTSKEFVAGRNRCSKYVPHQGKQEMARRRLRMGGGS